MANFDRGQLDANTESFSFTVAPGEGAVVQLDIASTITVTATANLPGGTASAFNLDGSSAQWTASELVTLTAPAKYTFTASGVTGGTCDYAYQVYRIV